MFVGQELISDRVGNCDRLRLARPVLRPGDVAAVEMRRPDEGSRALLGVLPQIFLGPKVHHAPGRYFQPEIAEGCWQRRDLLRHAVCRLLSGDMNEMLGVATPN